jgi:uncharacterized protein YbjT (DUF2867 family)
MILVTGAAGKTGRAIVRALAARGEAVRALVRRPDQMAQLQALGALEAVAGDITSISTLEEAALGARAIYHICPNVNPDEVAIGRAALAAARQSGVEQFVYHSVMHPQTPSMPHHWGKLYVEAALFESRLRYTILQPASYMQNVLALWPAVVSEGVYAVPYSVESRLTPVDLDDIAEVAGIVLTEPGHDNATYELAGPAALSSSEMAEVLSRKLGRSVKAAQLPIAAWKERAQASGLGAYQIDTLLKMFDYYDRHGFCGNPRILANLIGRPPTTFEAFVARV